MDKEYKLYHITGGNPHEVSKLDTDNKRVIIFGGIQDLCTLPLHKGSWTILNQALHHSFAKNTQLYTISTHTPLWHENDWVEKSFVHGDICPAAEGLAERLFALPHKDTPITDKEAFLKHLDHLAGNTVFVTFSTGSLLLQHVRQCLVQRLREDFTEEQLSPILAKVGALNVAPIYKVGTAPEKLDFTQIAFINRLDPYAAETPGIAKHWGDIKSSAKALQAQWDAKGGMPQFTFNAYQNGLKEREAQGILTANPNLMGAHEKWLGSLKINSRNLVVYGDSVTDSLPARVRHEIHNRKHSLKETRPSYPLREHDISLYLNTAAASISDTPHTYTVVHNFQRYAGAHLIPNAFRMLLHNEPVVDNLKNEITDEERTFVTGLFAGQRPIEGEGLPKR